MPLNESARPTVSLIPLERIESRVLLMRGEKVLLDSDLAALYGVTTKALNQAVRRNPERFPSDFMFQTNELESEALLRSQIATSKVKNEVNSLQSKDILRSQSATSIPL